MVARSSNAPARRHHRARARLEEGSGEALHALALDDDATAGAAGREHHQVRVEVQRGELPGADEAALTIASGERQRGARGGALVDQRVGGEVQDAEAPQIGVLEIGGARVVAQPDLGLGRVAGDELDLARRRLEPGQPAAGVEGRAEDLRRPAARLAGEGRIAERQEAHRAAVARAAPQRGRHRRRGHDAHREALDDAPPVGEAQRVPGQAVKRSVGDDDQPRDLGAEIGERRREQRPTEGLRRLARIAAALEQGDEATHLRRQRRRRARAGGRGPPTAGRRRGWPGRRARRRRARAVRCGRRGWPPQLPRR
jgi:hypothetical protein